MMTLEEEILFWKDQYLRAERKESAFIAWGIYIGLRIALEDYNERR